jgi:hypothetical protein
MIRHIFGMNGLAQLMKMFKLVLISKINSVKLQKKILTNKISFLSLLVEMVINPTKTDVGFNMVILTETAIAVYLQF